MSTTTADDKKLELIRQLLAKAEATQYPEEAETFTAHAERLMVRLGIDRAALANKNPDTITIVMKSVDFTGSYAIALFQGMAQVAMAYKTVRVLAGNIGSTKRVYLVGEPADVDMLIELLASLEKQALAAMKSWWKTSTTYGVPNTEYYRGAGSQAWHIRREFVLGFGNGVTRRVKDLLDGETDSQALVVVPRTQKIDEFINRQYGGTRKGRATSMRRGTRDAQMSGYGAGVAANLGTRKGVSS